MYDAIIVGAGPAGTSAALFAHKLGLKTILLDKSVFPRDKVCGDALSGKCIRIMRELNILEDISNLEGADINRITFGSPSHKQFDIQLNSSKKSGYVTKGFVVPRLIFDDFLFQKAKEVTDTREGFTVQNLTYSNGDINGVIGKSKDGKEEHFEAPLVIGADGANSIVARKLGLYELDMKNTSIAVRCYYSGVEGLTDQIELHYVNEVNPGYFWLFPAGGGKANIGIGLSKNDAKKDKRTLREILDEVTLSDYFKKRFKNAKQLEKPVGWNLPCGSIHRKNHGNGFMLLGDSAGLVDSFTGEGIGNAMVSGKYAMQVLSKAKKNNDYSEKNLSEYDRLLWGEVGKELKTSARLQNLGRSSFLLNFVINRAARSNEVQDIMAGMLSHEIPKSELSKPSFYFKILFS